MAECQEQRKSVCIGKNDGQCYNQHFRAIFSPNGDLERTYDYFHCVYIVHLTFISFAGESLDEVDTRTNLESLATEALRAVHQEGVKHQDVRRENMLF
ncbi:hypothetical protein IWW34DRAFT_348307 [Fusarium oxysporum f. sp. albedinis]|nr:hypothetical protein IWW34DRAFT_348307 [Fusarium oxysporum f. sp. albedinis]